MKELLNSDENTLEVDSLGGTFTLTLNDITILTSATRGDGKMGTSHIGTPIFGPDRSKLYGLNQHGNMRNEECDLERTNDNEVVISHLLSDTNYPKGIRAELTIALDELGATFRLKHTNTGDEKAALNSGLHFYFDAPSSYNGTKVNGVDISRLIEENVDGVAVPLLAENRILIPERPELMLIQEGLTFAMVWTGKNKETNDIDKTYVCIEPVENDPTSNYFGSPESMLLPGEERSSECSLRIVENQALN